jgi:thiol-disulfide isomerase/thioredoxin
VTRGNGLLAEFSGMHRMRGLAIAVACAAILAVAADLVAGGALRRAVSSMLHPQAAVQVGQALPALPLEGLDGSAVDLSTERGRITFVNVFATWCPPCRAETPDLAAFAQEASAKGIDVLGIDQQETPAAVDAFRRAFHTGYPMLIDPGWETKDALGARLIPRTIVVDGKGIVRAIVSGPMTRAQMDQLAAQALSSS